MAYVLVLHTVVVYRTCTSTSRTKWVQARGTNGCKLGAHTGASSGHGTQAIDSRGTCMGGRAMSARSTWACRAAARAHAPIAAARCRPPPSVPQALKGPAAARTWLIYDQAAPLGPDVSVGTHFGQVGGARPPTSIRSISNRCCINSRVSL